MGSRLICFRCLMPFPRGSWIPDWLTKHWLLDKLWYSGSLQVWVFRGHIPVRCTMPGGAHE
jgi:hypothetical protein